MQTKQALRPTATQHAARRIRERMGLPKKAVDDLVNRAYQDGVRHSELSGSLKRYIDGVYLRKERANEIRIYNQHVFLFQGSLLITVLELPNKYKRRAGGMGKCKNSQD